MGSIATKKGLPTYPFYVHPTLKAILKAGGSATIEEIEEIVSQDMKISEYLLSIPHGKSTRTEFQYRLAWVRTYLKKYGAIDNSERGVWSITEKGEGIGEQEALSVFQKIHAERSKKGRAHNLESENFDEIEEDVDSGPANWPDELLEIIGKIEASAFERLCQRLLRESGFTKVEVTGKPSDGGIDGIGVLRMNLVSFQVLFQCKRWKGTVPPSVIRDFRGAMVGRADKGLIITTSSFSSEAKREATRDGAPTIDLIDGETLCELLKQRRLGVQTQMVEEVIINKEFFSTI